MYEERSSKLSLDDRKWIEMRWAWLNYEFGESIPRKSIVALTEPEYFPDRYNHDLESARLYLNRVCEFMQVDPDLIDLKIFHQERAVTQGDGHSGALGLYVESDGRYEVWVEWEQLSEPLYLVGILAHEVAHVRLLGERRITDQQKDHELLTDLMTIFFGMGVFTANSRIFERSWDIGHHSSWQISRHGYMTMPMCGHALALFAMARNELKPSWSSYVRKDVRAYLTESLRTFQSAPKLLQPIAMDQAFADQYAMRLEQLKSNDDDSTSSDQNRRQSAWDPICNYCGRDIRKDDKNCRNCGRSVYENPDERAEELEHSLEQVPVRGIGLCLFFVIGVLAIGILLWAISSMKVETRKVPRKLTFLKSSPGTASLILDPRRKRDSKLHTILRVACTDTAGS